MPPLIVPMIVCLLVGRALALRFKFLVLLPTTIINYNYHTARDLGRHYRDGIRSGGSCVFVTRGSD